MIAEYPNCWKNYDCWKPSCYWNYGSKMNGWSLSGYCSNANWSLSCGSMNCANLSCVNCSNDSMILNLTSLNATNSNESLSYDWNCYASLKLSCWTSCGCYSNGLNYCVTNYYDWTIPSYWKKNGSMKNATTMNDCYCYVKMRQSCWNLNANSKRNCCCSNDYLTPNWKNSNDCWKLNCCLNYETNCYVNLNCDWSLNENSIPMNCYCYATSLNGNLSCGSMNCGSKR